MKTFKKIGAVVCGVAGVIFMLNGASDIQLGFGLVLIFMAIANY